MASVVAFVVARAPGLDDLADRGTVAADVLMANIRTLIEAELGQEVLQGLGASGSILIGRVVVIVPRHRAEGAVDLLGREPLELVRVVAGFLLV